MAVSRVSVNWNKLGDYFPRSNRGSYLALKKRSDEVRSRLSALPEKPVPLNFSEYRERLQDPSIVDKLEKAYKEVKVSRPPTTPTLKSIKEWEKVNQVRAVSALREAEEIIEKNELELSYFKDMRPFNEMTFEEYGDFCVKYKPSLIPNFEECPEWPYNVSYKLSRQYFFESKH